MPHATRFRHLGRSLATYLYTWYALAVIAAAHLAFAWWFQPSALWQSLALGLDMAGLLLWCVLTLRSDAFRQHYQRRPDAPTDQEVQRLLAACPPALAQPVQQCLELSIQIAAEFTALASRRELEALQQNLAQLVQAYHTLHRRAHRFGTPAQQATMAAMLRTQEASVASTLHSLQTLGGHLTLLSAQATPERDARQALHALNQGLEAVLQEFYHSLRKASAFMPGI